MQIKPNASPFTFTAPADGLVAIADGGISEIEFSRSDSGFLGLGAYRGLFPVEAGDKLRVTFQVAPAVHFIASGKQP